MAPELVEICEEEGPEEENESIPRVTVETDVWAFGMKVFTESVPFSYIKGDASVIHHVVSGGRPKREHYLQIDEEIWTVLESCWDVEPTRRPSMTALTVLFHAIDLDCKTPPIVTDVGYPMVDSMEIARN